MVSGIATSLLQAADWLGAELFGRDGLFTGVSSDSRNLHPGALFVALHGPNHDGHRYLAAAVEKGAAAALVDHRCESSLPQLVVDDTRLALGRLAAAWRQALGLTLIAVTGSNGKTTTKEMVAAVIARSGRVTATRGNLNNAIGVPMTLLAMGREHDFGVVEMGANHPGEIALLTDITRPQVAVITNAGAAHLEGFSTIEGVARAKGEIFAGLGESGVAVINADDNFANLWRGLNRNRPIISFGMEQPADVHGRWRSLGESGELHVQYGEEEARIVLPLPGCHNGYNALAACAVAVASGLGLEQVEAALAHFDGVGGRLRIRHGLAGARVIDDSYNANPASLKAAIDVLASFTGRRFIALGDMSELGDESEALHRAAGMEAYAAGIDRLYATGKASRASAEAFGSDGCFYDEAAALVAALEEDLATDVTLLVKGSRSSQMERVVAALCGAEGK